MKNHSNWEIQGFPKVHDTWINHVIWQYVPKCRSINAETDIPLSPDA